MPSVKGRKTSRTDRARRTRRRILESARELFGAERYAATTMEQITTAAGVAAQTVYYTFRTKGRLLCEVVEFAAAEEGEPLPVAQRPWMRETLNSPSAQRASVVSSGPDSASRKSATVVVRAYGVLAGVVDRAVKDRRLESNPVRGVNLPRKRSKPRHYLSHRQVRLLATEARSHGTLVLLLSYTGLRWVRPSRSVSVQLIWTGAGSSSPPTR